MRIFVSSSFEDLKEHRTAAIRVLRQLGHEVLAMEDMVAGSAIPLAKVLEMVDRSEAYVGIFAWRYGYIPQKTDKQQPPGGKEIPFVDGAVEGETSITHYEYLRALQRKVPVLTFLLDENYPWPPQYIDGFDKTRAKAPANADNIRDLRQLLQQERVVSWFTTPSDLEARVGAAVTMAGLSSQLNVLPAAALPAYTGVPGDSSAEFGITQAIIDAGDKQPALKLDIKTTWWSTRLYLIATLAHRLTRARRIVVVDSKPTVTSTIAEEPSADPLERIEEHFIGQLSTSEILSTIGSKLRQLRIFERWLHKRPDEYSDVSVEISEILDGWRKAFADEIGIHANEQTAKVDLTAELLRRWFGDAMLQQAVYIADLRRASVVDLLRLLDYPNDYVPVLTRQESPNQGQADTKRVDVVDKGALNARLARNYLIELLDRARIK